MIAKVLALVAGTASAVNAYTLTTMLSGNPVLTPNNNGGTEPTIGQAYTITWDGTGLSSVVDLAICQGPSTTCNVIGNIALQIPNSNSYSWTPDCSLAATTSNAGYGILLIDDVTGMYQYSTQFGLQPDTSGACGANSGGPSGSPTVSPTGSATGTGGHTKTGSGSGSMTTSTTTSSSGGSAPSQSSAGSAPTGPPSGYGVNSTSTAYVVPTGGPGSSTPAPTVTASPGGAASVALSVGGMAAAALAAALFLV